MTYAPLNHNAYTQVALCSLRTVVKPGEGTITEIDVVRKRHLLERPSLAQEMADFFFSLFCEPNNSKHMKALGGHSGHGLLI